ncbi:MAG: MBL fold metallo-hydrolase [Candidatus Kariarchaeaceae archaeon]|jgi:predicted metal-dependent RNase
MIIEDGVGRDDELHHEVITMNTNDTTSTNSTNSATQTFETRNGPITITGYGASSEVGRSAFIIEDSKRKILVEGGLKIMPGDELTLAPDGLKQRIHELNAAVLSHAHVDHSGYLPALYENGYFGKLYMTTPTLDIVQVLWADHLKIEGSRHWSPAGMERAIDNTVTMKYHTKKEIVEGVTIEFFNAGHILGSGMILIDWDGFLILFTGDINDNQTPLFEGFEIPDVEVDVLISESTNGCRHVTPREEVNTDFIQEIKNTLDKGHKVIIPCFALGRSQELLTVLTKHIKDYPIYVDGMIRTMNALTEKYLNPNWIDEPLLNRMREEGIFSPFRYENVIEISPENFDRTHDFRRYLGQLDEPVIILTTSGMMEPSPLHSHLRFSARKPETLIAVVGYQAEGTKGRAILEGQRKITLSVDWNREEEVEIKARVMRFHYSGHTSADGIKDLIDAVKPKQIYFIHGGVEEQDDLRQKLSNGIVPVSLEIGKTEILAQ